eukprot:UN20283
MKSKTMRPISLGAAESYLIFERPRKKSPSPKSKSPPKGGYTHPVFYQNKIYKNVRVRFSKKIRILLSKYIWLLPKIYFKLS